MRDSVQTRGLTKQLLDAGTDTLSDEQLMQAHLEGKEWAFELLIQRYERELYSYLRRMILDSGLAEDVFQNTFLQLHKKRHLYQIGRPVRPWLYTIATHQLIDALRRNRRHRRPSLDVEYESQEHEGSGSLLEMIPGKSVDPVLDAERNERKLLVRQVVDGLPEHLRVVIVLSYYQGMKYKEIAEVLGIPVGTVKSRLHAAIVRLGDRWKKLGFTKDG